MFHFCFCTSNVKCLLCVHRHILLWQIFSCVTRNDKVTAVVLKKKHISLNLWCEKKCLILMSTRWPTFCMSPWTKTVSGTLFNSAFVFDERFCLDYISQEGGGASVPNTVHTLSALPMGDSGLRRPGCVPLSVCIQLWKYLVFNWRVQESRIGDRDPQPPTSPHPQNKRGLSMLLTFYCDWESIWMVALWDHITEVDDTSEIVVCFVEFAHSSCPQIPTWTLSSLYPFFSWSPYHCLTIVCSSERNEHSNE